MKRGSDWSPIYMLLVVVIVAIVLITVMKPIFQSAGNTAASNAQQAKTVAGGSLYPTNAVTPDARAATSSQRNERGFLFA